MNVFQMMTKPYLEDTVITARLKFASWQCVVVQTEKKFQCLVG